MKLQVVSNRLPIAVFYKDGELNVERSSGGLATGMSTLQEDLDMIWTGWPGMNNPSSEEKKEIESYMAEQGLAPVWLSKTDHNGYYRGFSNKIIWPLFHYFSQYAKYSEIFWLSYLKVNRLFCDRLLETASEDDLFWINDYHLMLLPQMLRKRLPNARIGFFLHIPFPHYEVFRQLPWRREILEGLSGADLVGFHTRQYADYFLHSVGRILNAEIQGNAFESDARTVRAGAFPMGIDYRKFADNAGSSAVIGKAQAYHEEYQGNKIILSVDRLDYSKGIIQRLKGFDLFLENNPEYREKISLLELIVPSRVKVERYQLLKKAIDEYSGKINGKYGTPFWTPVRYFYRSVDFDTLCALYLSADIALITPHRDGMNLVAKEYVAVQQDRPGALILSEFAGAAQQLTESIIVNPNNINEVAEAIEKALRMPDDEKRRRLRRMQTIIRDSNVRLWATHFMEQLTMHSSPSEQAQNSPVL